MKRIYLSVLAMCLILTLLLAGCGIRRFTAERNNTQCLGDQSSDYNELGHSQYRTQKKSFQFWHRG